MRQLQYLDQVDEDLGSIFEYLAERSGDVEVAAEFVARLVFHCERLAELPGMIGQVRPHLSEDMRCYPFGNYVILFRYRDDVLEVVSIVERHRDIEQMFGGE